MFERIRKSHYLKTLNVRNVEFFLGLLALAPHAMTSFPRLIVASTQAYIGECAINLTDEFGCHYCNSMDNRTYCSRHFHLPDSNIANAQAVQDT